MLNCSSLTSVNHGNPSSHTIWDKMMMGLMSSKRFNTSFVLFLIAFPLLLILTFIIHHQNSSFTPFLGLSKTKELGTQTHNVTSEKEALHNISDNNNIGGGERYNNTTLSKVAEKIQNVTAAAEPEGIATSKNITSSVSENGSLTSSADDLTARVEIPDDKDNLLHGLLASGFDESSCISRLQFHLFRKASPHKPSPYLISKLRSYEEIHTRCGPNTRDYNRSMTNIVHSYKNTGASSASASCKYLIWTPTNGLGNQMISIVAAFLYAVLTERVLLVKFGKDKHGLFCEPFLNSTWILPEKSPFWNVGKGKVQTYQSMLERNMANSSTTKEHLPPSVLFLSLKHTRDDPEKFFHCDRSQALLQKVPLLILQSDQYFVPSLFMTPIFNPELNKMFPEKDTIFHHLGRYLFHPSNEAWRLISGFYQQSLANADERIGLQIRVFSPDSTPQKAIMDLVLSCTKQHKLLPEVLSIENSTSSSVINQTVKAVLVASLHPEYGENLRAMYLKKPTVTGEVVEVYQPSHEEHQKFHDNMHNLKAWVDMYLLSLSDVLVTTSLSTFGYVAQGLGNLRPWLLYRLVNNETHFPPCERDFSMEPCYHISPKHYCNGNPIQDFSSFLHLRYCKDYYLGVKLVNASIPL